MRAKKSSMKSWSASAEQVFVDAGPLIALARVNRLDLLQHIFMQVQITDIVATECLAKPDFPEQALIQSALDHRLITLRQWFKPQSAETWRLDKGEASTIEAALHSDSAVLVDDRAARLVAKALDIPLLGTCGLLFVAKQKGLIKELAPLLDTLVDSGYFLGQNLVERVLRMAGED